MEAQVTAIIPTFRRTAQLLATLERILACDPKPSALLVHVDAGDEDTAPAVRARFAEQVGILESKSPIGPGGGRQRLIGEVRTLLFASFDDDSWPVDSDYFARGEKLMAKEPQTAVLTGVTTLTGESPPPSRNECRPAACFEGCGHFGRAVAFGKVSGYVPLRHAYGMEEADVALQLMDAGWQINRHDSLRVWHDTALTHHASAEINAAQIANTALKVFLRYPASWWPRGILQVINRIKYTLVVGRWRGAARGISSIPVHCWKYRRYRAKVMAETLAQAAALGQADRRKNIHPC
jgi:GT2 family glycosyltransferase